MVLYCKIWDNGLPEIINVTIYLDVSYFTYVLSKINEGINVCNFKRGKGVLP